jgi:protein-S-isoprenylcysteine O-methyltransferase Ste14
VRENHFGRPYHATAALSRAAKVTLAAAVIGMPLALGSWLTICLLPLILPVLVWRLLDEERILRRDLPGYNEYASRVRHRLIPYIW